MLPDYWEDIFPPGFAPMLIEFSKNMGKSRDKSHFTDQKTSSTLVLTSLVWGQEEKSHDMQKFTPNHNKHNCDVTTLGARRATSTGTKFWSSGVSLSQQCNIHCPSVLSQMYRLSIEFSSSFYHSLDTVYLSLDKFVVKYLIFYLSIQ